MISDPELRALFAAESEEHLETLDAGLLRLESGADARAETHTVEAVFRAAHSLKGAARMLELSEIEELAHQFEDALAGVAKNGQRLEIAQIEQLTQSLGALRALVAAALGDSGHWPSAQIQLAPQEKGAETAPAIEKDAASERDLPVSPTVTAFGSGSGWKIETLRVDPQKLDVLLAMAGELVVSTKRAARGKAELETLFALREESQKLAATRKRLLRQLETAIPASQRALLLEFERALTRDDERQETQNAVLERLRHSYEDVARLDSVVSALEEAIHSVRLLPLSTLFSQFPRMVRDLARAQAKDVELHIEGGEVGADKRLIEELKDPLVHLLRNAIDHGIEPPEARERAGKRRAATLQLRGFQSATQIVVELRDDGRGLDFEAIKNSALAKNLVAADDLETMTPQAIQDLIFAPGFSTATRISDVSGRGVGLDVVRANVENLRGYIEVFSESGQGCTFRLCLPVTLATTRVLLVVVNGQTFALPIENVHSVRQIRAGETFSLQNQPTFTLGEFTVSLAALHELLGFAPPAPKTAPTFQPCVVVGVGNEKLGLLVESVIEEQEIILKPPGISLRGVSVLSGATILETGEVCLVLSIPELIKSASRPRTPPETRAPLARQNEILNLAPKTLLLAEDSIITRTQEKRILESAGYRVVTAVDGLDAWNKLREAEAQGTPFDGVVSDIEMPKIDGFALASRIRSDTKFREIPVILVSSLESEADFARGLEVGADAYLCKARFDQSELLETLRRLV